MVFTFHDVLLSTKLASVPNLIQKILPPLHYLVSVLDERSFYEFQLFSLTLLCTLCLAFDRYSRVGFQPSQGLAPGHNVSSNVVTLRRQYLIVYAIVMAADWLQGPYLYSLYQEQYAFSERITAVLFITGFLSAGVTAPFIGVWADHHGRRKLCLIFCGTYIGTCLCILTPRLPVLLFGRVLGGLSTSILFSAFESWVISASSTQGLQQSDVSSILGRATLVNGFVAMGAGIASNKLVNMSGSFATPFIGSIAMLTLGWLVIRVTWTENYGSKDDVANNEWFQLWRLKLVWKILVQDPRLLILGLTQTCFEGSMYLFVFVWVPSLQEASVTYPATSLPLGYIFSAFMLSMMCGSILYTTITSYCLRSVKKQLNDQSLLLHAKLSSLVCLVSASALAISVNCKHEHVRFWAFCVFEACVGMYYPVQGMLRGFLISNEHRATLSSLFRVPLNAFVLASLLIGVSSRYAVLTGSSLILIFSAIMTRIRIVAIQAKPVSGGEDDNRRRDSTE